MRIRTDGKFTYREDLVDDIADLLGENTRVGAVEASHEFYAGDVAGNFRREC